MILEKEAQCASISGTSEHVNTPLFTKRETSRQHVSSTSNSLVSWLLGCFLQRRPNTWRDASTSFSERREVRHACVMPPCGRLPRPSHSSEHKNGATQVDY